MRLLVAVLVLASCGRSNREEAPHPAVTVIHSPPDVAPPDLAIVDAGADAEDADADGSTDIAFPAVTLTHAMFMAVVARELPAAKRRCGKFGGAHGVAVWQVTVGTDGRVTGTSGKSPGGTAHSCVMADVMGFTFPPSFSGGTFPLTVSFP